MFTKTFPKTKYLITFATVFTVFVCVCVNQNYRN